MHEGRTLLWRNQKADEVLKRDGKRKALPVARGDREVRGKYISEGGGKRGGGGRNQLTAMSGETMQKPQWVA